MGNKPVVQEAAGQPLIVFWGRGFTQLLFAVTHEADDTDPMRLTFIAAATTVLPIPALAAGSTQPTWQTTPQGQLVLRAFRNAPYPHPSRAQRFKGRATTFPADPHYTDSTIGIFIPSGYAPGDAVDYVVHF